MSERTVHNDYILKLISVRAFLTRKCLGTCQGAALGSGRELQLSPRHAQTSEKVTGDPRSTAAATCTKHKDASAPNQLPRNILRPAKGCILYQRQQQGLVRKRAARGQGVAYALCTLHGAGGLSSGS